MSGEHTLKAVRGSFIDVTRTVDNPEEIASALRFIEDGLLLIKQGKVEWFGEWEDGKHQIPDTIRVRDYRGKLIVPGFVDTHIHYPQSEMVGAYGEQLLEWLNKHTFPTERRYEDLEYAREMSAFFIKQLGHLIPAGTGQREFEKIIVGSKEEYDRILANRKNVLDYSEVE